MAKYNFQIRNYHAVKHADLEIGGITVVAGVNGCGKSTLSRWLYYIVNVMASFDNLLFEDFRNQIVLSLQKCSKAFDDMADYTGDGPRRDFEHCLSLMAKTTLDNGGMGKARFYYDRAMDCLDESLEVYIPNEQDTNKLKRVLNLFGVTGAEHHHEEMGKFTIREFSKYELAYSKAKAERRKSVLADKIRVLYSEKDVFPTDTSFKEDGVELLSDKVGTVYNMERAIYIGTPTAISLRQSDRVMMQELKDKVFSSNDRSVDVNVRQAMIDTIRQMLDGTIVEKENFGEVDLIYRSKDGMDIRLEDVASGFKPLAYLQRLIENGWLTEGTLLEIDEPETNLHPQWVVEFARLLVLINKNFGTKIFITSHNPDMVSAIKYISESEGVAGSTRFYLAELFENGGQYEYHDLGNDINPVFNSFNQSFSTLEKYATDPLHLSLLKRKVSQNPNWKIIDAEQFRSLFTQE